MNKSKLLKVKYCICPIVIVKMLLTLIPITYFIDIHGLEVSMFFMGKAFYPNLLISLFCMAMFIAINMTFFIATLMIIRPIFSKAIFVVATLFLVDVVYISYEVYQYYFISNVKYFIDDMYASPDYLIFPSYISRLIAQLVFELFLAIALIVYGKLAQKFNAKA